MKKREKSTGRQKIEKSEVRCRCRCRAGAFKEMATEAELGGVKNELISRAGACKDSYL
jgi:hypothetical protein